MKLFRGLFLFLLVLPAGSSAAGPAKIFSDHMVLQCELPVPVWGRAAAGSEVVVEFAGQSVKTKTDDEGRWKILLEPLKANAAGRDLVVQVAAERTVIRDVLVGEVWFAGGQSNMDYRVGGMARRLAEGRALVKAAELPSIRFRKINESNSPTPQDDLKRGGGWVVCGPGTVSGFSAVAYVFAQRLHRELGVPVGVMDCSWGGTPIEPYIPIEAFKGHPTLERLGELGKAGDIAGVRALAGGTYARSAAWLAGAIYNGRIAPVVPYAIRGAIWYQGESNAGRAKEYETIFPLLIQDWRKQWKRELPFYFVQLANFRMPTSKPGQASSWAELQNAQRLALRLPKTGMAVINDIGAARDIHPRNKKDVGERLARWALANEYGSKDVVVSGPLYRDFKVDGSRVRISFEYAEGLKTCDGGEPGRFEIAGRDQVWHWGKASIDGEAVLVASEEVPEPVAVRYAWASNPEGANLVNAAELPASLFRTDSWTLSTER